MCYNIPIKQHLIFTDDTSWFIKIFTFLIITSLLLLFPAHCIWSVLHISYKKKRKIWCIAFADYCLKYWYTNHVMCRSKIKIDEIWGFHSGRKEKLWSSRIWYVLLSFPVRRIWCLDLFLNMEAVDFCKMLVTAHETTQCCNPEYDSAEGAELFLRYWHMAANKSHEIQMLKFK